MRLIEADALLAAYDSQHHGEPGKARKLIENVPTVDAVPVVHGRWVEYPECLRFYGATSKDNIVCSACHSVWSIMDNDTEKFDFCPHCGARIDGGETDDNG